MAFCRGDQWDVASNLNWNVVGILCGKLNENAIDRILLLSFLLIFRVVFPCG